VRTSGELFGQLLSTNTSDSKSPFWDRNYSIELASPSTVITFLVWVRARHCIAAANPEKKLANEALTALVVDFLVFFWYCLLLSRGQIQEL
jgi:hypothetical protein